MASCCGTISAKDKPRQDTKNKNKTIDPTKVQNKNNLEIHQNEKIFSDRSDGRMYSGNCRS